MHNAVLLDARDRDGKTALIWSCSSGKDIIARLLLESGADKELKDNNHYSPILWAASRGAHISILRNTF